MASRRIAIALHHRDRFSEGHMRKVFGYEAYHWAIIIMPEQSQGPDCWSFEATDATEIDPVTFRMHNPTMSWWLRSKDNVDLQADSKLLGTIVIGQMPPDVSFPDIKSVMEDVPLPIRNLDPQQSCVTWVESAIRALQEQEWLPEFDISHLKDWVLAYADDRIKRQDAQEPSVVSYR